MLSKNSVVREKNHAILETEGNDRTMKKYDFIDFMKTLAMFAVIAAHCAFFYSGNQFWVIKAEQEIPLLKWLSNFILVSAVPIFVFAAGFLLQLSLQKNKYSMADLIRKKAVRLLIPYFLYGALWLVPMYTLFDIQSFGRDKGATLIEGYKAMALGLFSDMAWFLLMLFWVTLIWILLNLFLKKSNILFGAVVSVALFIAAHCFLGKIDYFKLSQIDIYIVVFFVGAAFFYITDYVYNSVSKWIMISGSLAAIIACVFLAQLSTQMYIMDCFLKVVTPVLFLILSMGLCQTKAVGKLEKTSGYNWLRRNSLYIYLFQAPWVYVLFGILYPVIGSSALLCFSALFLLTILSDVIVTFVFGLVCRFLKGR